MAQVIEVRFVNPADTKEVLADEFTKATTHREAIELALDAWSGGVGVLKGMQPYTPGEWLSRGANSCWRYSYSCTLEDTEYDQEVLVVLFAQYKEKEQEGELDQ